MSELGAILDAVPFDLSTLVDTDVQSIESAVYGQPLVYKYYAPARRHFFERPQVRFSPRDALNDPLEMSERWKDISTEGLKNYVSVMLADALPKAFGSTSYLVAKAKEHLTEKGVVLTDQQERNIERFFESEAGKSYISSQLPNAQSMTAMAVEYVFSHIEGQFQQFIDGFVAKTGVLSLTEDALNQQMWAHYAASGAGFVVGLDAHHEFFRGKGDLATKNLLRKVVYTDERTQTFWRNPYFLFLVKNTGWAYEREWRLIKELSECDEERTVGGQSIALWNLPSPILRTVYFGYNYDRSNIVADIASITRLGATPPMFYSVQVNRKLGVLDATELAI